MILDTCALLFLATGDKRLNRRVRDRLAGIPVRWYSAISGFEVALKVRQRKLRLPLDPNLWFGELAQRYQLTEVPLTTDLCLDAATLPLHHHDPFDRFIIATAIQLDAPVVTIDHKFAAYGVEVVC